MSRKRRNSLADGAAAQRAHANRTETLREKFKNLRDRAGHLLTHFQNGSLYVEQGLANFDYQSDPDAGALFGTFKNVLLVIVSARPSLEGKVRELRGNQDRRLFWPSIQPSGRVGQQGQHRMR